MSNRTQQGFSIGIVGAGDIVVNAHLPVLLAMDNVSVDWITDLDQETLRRVARSFNLAACKLPEDLSKLPDVDVVLLAIPFGAREPYYEALRDRNLALYVEKPFATSTEQHRRICSYFPDYRLACGFQRRVFGYTELAKQILEEEVFGPLEGVRYGFGKAGLSLSGKYYSDLRLAGGGILLETAIHGLDAVLFCTSACSAQVTSCKMIFDAGFDLHTEAKLWITSTRGDSIGCEILVSSLQDTSGEIEFVFENVVLGLSFGRNYLSVRPSNGSGRYAIFGENDGALAVNVNQYFYKYWSIFLDGIRNQRANITSASESALTTNVIENLYLAGRNHE